MHRHGECVQRACTEGHRLRSRSRLQMQCNGGCGCGCECEERGEAARVALLTLQRDRSGRAGEGRKEGMGGRKGNGGLQGNWGMQWEGPGGSSPALGKTAAAAERTLTLAAAAVRRRRRRRRGGQLGNGVWEWRVDWRGEAGSTSSVGMGWDGMGVSFLCRPPLPFWFPHFLRRGPREKL